ncbi:MAG: CRISPR-associated protein Cas5 [Methanocellales archaeon]|nr:CRISPR-associated protein Cas5 [Methanocellales archaeon]
MVWFKAEYEFGSLFSYRMPDFSSQYALSLPLPGPSTIKLATVATAIESTGNLKYGKEIFELIKNAEIKIGMPKRIGISNVLIKRLKKKKDKKELETTFGIRGYVHFLEPIEIYVNAKEYARDIGNLLRRIRRFGTSDSLVCCKSPISEEEPPENCIEAVDHFPEKAERNMLVVPVKDLNQDEKVRFEHVNPYDEAPSKDVFVRKFYFIPILNSREGKNWTVYEVAP